MSLTLRAQIDETVVRVGAATLTLVPQIPYPGGFDVPAGTQNEAITYLATTRPLTTNTVTPAELGVLREQFDATSGAVDAFGANLESIAQNQTGIRTDLNALISTVASLNTAGLVSYTLNSSNQLVFNYTDGSTKNLGFFPVERQYRGTATAKPTVAGVQGDIFRNNNPATRIIQWRCTTSGVAQGGAGTVAIWEAEGAAVYEGMTFDFDANRPYSFPVPEARTMEAPLYYGAVSASNVVWAYTTSAAWTGFTTVNTWPLTMAAGSTLRATVSGLAVSAIGAATLKRLS